MSTEIIRFTAYRRNLASRGTHVPGVQANPDDQPQYEGVVFSSGKCVIHWLTASKSVSIFDSLEQMLQIHGHPEYGTEIVWHDGALPEEWKHMLIAHAEHVQGGFHAAGYTDVTLQVEETDSGQLVGLVLKNMDETIKQRVYPVQEGT
jgi:hypothetical protein